MSIAIHLYNGDCRCKSCLDHERGTPTERVAKAMRKAQCGSMHFNNEYQHKEFLRMAQAAIAALQLTEERQELYLGGSLLGTKVQQARLVGPWVEESKQ